MKIFGCGQNSVGEIGPRKPTDGLYALKIREIDFGLPEIPKDVLISVGYSQTIYVFPDGSVYATGDDRKCVISCEGNAIYTKPTKVSIRGKKIIEAVAGFEYTFYRAADNSFYMCTPGQTRNFFKIKLNNINPVSIVGGYSYVGIIGSGCFVLVTKQECDHYEPHNIENEEVVSVALCSSFIVALTKSNKVFRSVSEITNKKQSKIDFVHAEEINEPAIQVSGFNGHALVLTETGDVYAMGEGSFGQLGIGIVKKFQETFIKVPIDEIMRVSAGNSQSLFLKNNNELYGCGENKRGQLMLENDRSPITEITKCNISNVTHMDTGFRHSIAIVGGEKKYLKLRKADSNLSSRSFLSSADDILSDLSQKGKKKQLELSQFIIDPKNINEIKKIGRGSNGYVMMVTLSTKHDETIAAKYYFVQDEQKCSINGQRFIRECEIMITMNHPCITKFHGYCFSTSRKPAILFMEYCANGSLQKQIDTKPIEWTNTLKAIAIMEIVKGMIYLHENDIIHRDLKPSNILITKDFDAKISDFNEATYAPLDDSEIQTKKVGSFAYMSPEMLDDDYQGQYTNKTDVFSFAIILFYMVVGSLPLVPLMKFLKGQRADIPNNVPNFVKELIQQCWSAKSEQRPSFKQIDEILMNNSFSIFTDVNTEMVIQKAQEIDAQTEDIQSILSNDVDLN